jgi:sugar lactone lactonase YvrE
MTAAVVHAALELDLGAELGEGPVWDPRTHSLYFVDILRGHVHSYRPDTRALSTCVIDQPVGAVALSETGDLLLAIRDGFARLDPATGKFAMIAAVSHERSDLRMNDGNCDPAGRFWAGTMALDERPGAGALYCLSPECRVDRVLQNVTISNGIDWSADARTMYFIDSPTQRIEAFDFEVETGAIANRRPFVRIPQEAGLPDGLTLDGEGFVWVSLWQGGSVHRYAPDGRLDMIVRLPVTHPTSCAFGGEDMRDLYITTATVALTDAERDRQPGAGGVFRCQPGPAGRPPNRFKG